MDTGFRDMRRGGQRLTDAACRELLKTETRGVLAVQGDGGYPYAFPMNFSYSEDTGKLYLHGARAGHKIDAMRRCDKICFCVHDEGCAVEGSWKKRVKSVIVFGRARFLDAPADALDGMRRFDRKFESDEAVEAHLEREGARVLALELSVEHMTGKQVIEG